MFILKKEIFDKILPKNKQHNSNENYSKLLEFENDNQRKSYYKNKDMNRFLKIQNKQLYEENIQIKKENEKLKKLNSFINFQEFLSNSFVSPIIKKPFSAENKRVFAFMDHISKFLIQNTKKIDNKPLVSIIMPTYNREDIILNAINSVLNQTYENWELIIIDDGSTDNTLNLLNNIQNTKIKILSYSTNKGHSFARNEGLKKTTGKYVMYLDSDNEWDSRYIETMVGAFLELPDADAIYSGQLLYENYDSKPHAIRFGSYNKPLLHNRNYIDINCFSHKNYIYDVMGGFNEDLIKLVDWEFILRISNEFKIYSIPVLLSKYYISNSSNRVTDFPFDYDEKAAKILTENNFVSKKYENLSHKISIIIPSYESLNELKLCIETILSFNLDDFVDIIVVDNNSSIEVKKYLEDLKSKQKIKLIKNNVNYGFTFAVTQGIAMSDNNSDILILNNDAVLTEGALEHLQMGAYNYNDCGIIVPHELVSEKNPHMNLHVPYADSQFKCDVTPSKIHHNIINMPLFHDGEKLELNFAPFFCAYIKRGVYDKTLGLDPELGRHYRSDRIFSDFVRHVLKMKIYQEPNAYVYHIHQVATNSLRENATEFDEMFIKNQWPSNLAKKLGYKKALWD